MVRRKAPRLALAVACAALTACVVNLSFDMDQANIAVLTPMASDISQSVLVDLGSYSDIREHNGDIRSLDLEYVDVTITTVNSGNAAKTIDARITLRKNLDDQPDFDVLVGDVASFQVQKNATRRIQGNPQLDAFLLERLHDGGKFYVIITGTTDNKTDLALDVNLHASMAYDSGLF